MRIASRRLDDEGNDEQRHDVDELEHRIESVANVLVGDDFKAG